jgi:hypothetical protein
MHSELLKLGGAVLLIGTAVLGEGNMSTASEWVYLKRAWVSFAGKIVADSGQ